MFSRFSFLRRSGTKPGTTEPGAPVFPPEGVTPPDPEKYGTLASRWLYSQRNVMYWLGIQSKVPDASQALYGSPGFSVKYGVPEVAVAPLMGGSSTRYRPGLLIFPRPRLPRTGPCETTNGCKAC